MIMIEHQSYAFVNCLRKLWESEGNQKVLLFVDDLSGLEVDNYALDGGETMHVTQRV